MKQSGHLSSNETLNETSLRQHLNERFASVDFDQAKRDVLPFIKNPEDVKIWSQDFFASITKDRLKIASES